MKQVHVECLPDELLVSKLGFRAKSITHHTGKSRVFHVLSKNENQLAIVDEDPGSPKTSYEKSLKLLEEFEGISYFVDKSGNKVFILKGKLEDWTIRLCKQHKIKLSNFNLPEKPNDLHGVIHLRLSNFADLLDVLLRKNNPGILKLKTWLRQE